MLLTSNVWWFLGLVNQGTVHVLIFLYNAVNNCSEVSFTDMKEHDNIHASAFSS